MCRVNVVSKAQVHFSALTPLSNSAVIQRNCFSLAFMPVDRNDSLYSIQCWSARLVVQSSAFTYSHCVLLTSTLGTLVS